LLHQAKGFSLTKPLINPTDSKDILPHDENNSILDSRSARRMDDAALLPGRR
jgi:hypothetical protein